MGGGRWRRGGEQVLQNKKTAFDRRSPRGIGGDDKKGALAEEPATRRVLRQFNEPHLLALHIRNAIPLCQFLVEKSVAGVEEFGRRQIFLQHMGEKHLCLLSHGSAEVAVEYPESLGEIPDAKDPAGIDINGFHIPRFEPLADEILRKPPGFGIGKKPVHLGPEIFPQIAFTGEPHQFVIRGGGP